MIQDLPLDCQSDIRPDRLDRRLEAAEVIGLTESLAAQAYLHLSMNDCPIDHA